MAEILIVAPHPDDEILGCGGSIIKFLNTGHKVGILYLSSGNSQEEIREKEAHQVCNSLEIGDRFFLRMKGKDFSAETKSIENVHGVFEKFSPDVVYCCHDQESDIEHRIANQLIMESYWRFNSLPIVRKKISTLIMYEVHKPMSSYNLIEDISGVVERKIEALSIYKSQLAVSNLDLAIRGLNQYRGEMHENCAYAEVFQIRKMHSLFGLH